MAAVAQRTTTYHRQASQGRRAAPVKAARVRRRPRPRFIRLARLAVLAFCLIGLFGYASIYGNLTVAGYNRSKLMDAYRSELLENQRLKVEWISLGSPNRVVAAAEKSGMVYATDYEYLGKPQTVASAD